MWFADLYVVAGRGGGAGERGEGSEIDPIGTVRGLDSYSLWGRAEMANPKRHKGFRRRPRLESNQRHPV